MVDDKMRICVRNDELLSRIGEAEVCKVLEKGNYKQMMHNGKAMKDYIFVEDILLRKKRELENWVKLCLDFNVHAKSSKKKSG